MDNAMLDAVWLIPALPLAGFLVLVAFGRRLGEPLAGWLGTAAVGGSFVAAVVTFLGLFDLDAHDRSVTKTLFEWVPAGDLSVDVAALIDPLSVVMVLFVTGVSTLIHLYSIGYMHGDEKFSKFFVYLNLFVFSMTMLVLGDNLLITFLGWEGVGVCSYFLISFWFSDEANAAAGKKAFVTNRIGDVGFMLAIFLAFTTVGGIGYLELFEGAEALTETTVTAIALLLFVGAIGKSAQLPLYVWLPDAMAGPTPVSALIHAATMVTSGVYLMARVNPLLALSADALDLIAWVGAITAFVAATIAVAQRDIKKVLAYSTVSQLGYMFLAIGSGAYVAAIFHMVTHAFFKALLFLGSGSVIHGMGGEQDMDRMGGLRKYLPITAGTFIVGWLAIAGVPPFAGFWSKDEILINAWDKSEALWAIGVVTAVLTAYYMSRQVFMVFFGEPRAASVDAHRADDEAGEASEPHADHGAPHESPWQMTLPLVVLAGLSVAGGAINLPFKGNLHLEHWLEPVFEGSLHHVEATTTLKWTLPFVVLGLSLLGVGFAALVYLRGTVRRETVEPELLARGWYYDELIGRAVDGPVRAGATLLAEQVDARGIDGAVNGAGWLARTAGTRLRPLQSGLVRNYALAISGGAVLLLAYVALRAGA